MKKLATLVAGLLLVGGIADAADYLVVSEGTFRNEAYNDDHRIDWEMAKGYMALGEDLTMIFNTKKSFWELSDDEYMSAELGLVKRLPSTEFIGKEWSNEVALKYFVEDTDGADDKDITSLTYVTGTDIGWGMHANFEFVGRLDEELDTYNANMFLGKKLADNLSLSMEFINDFNPDADDEHNFAFKTFMNYWKDLGAGFSFNTEFAFIDDDMEIAGKWGPTTAYIAPQLKYTYAINENVNAYTGVVYEAVKVHTDNLFDEDFSQTDGNFNAYLGFSYTK